VDAGGADHSGVAGGHSGRQSRVPNPLAGGAPFRGGGAPDEKLAIGLGLVSAAVITFALYPLLFAIGGARLGWALTLLAFVILVYLSVVSISSA
jgi:hypothetical protein